MAEVSRHQQLMQLLAHKGEITTTELAEGLGIQQEHARVLLYKARKRGDVAMVAPGRYSTATNPLLASHLPARTRKAKPQAQPGRKQGAFSILTQIYHLRKQDKHAFDEAYEAVKQLQDQDSQ